VQAMVHLPNKSLRRFYSTRSLVFDASPRLTSGRGRNYERQSPPSHQEACGEEQDDHSGEIGNSRGI
jgi:hypothetical protein